MKAFEWIELAVQVGLKIMQLAREGKRTVRIEDVLPKKYWDQELLEELTAQAKEDYDG